MKGLLIGVVLNTWFSYFVNIGLVSKHIGYKWWRQILDILPVAIASIVAALISYGVGYLLKLDMYSDGAVKILVYALVYLGWSFIMKPEAFTYVLSLLPDRIKKKYLKNITI